MKFSRRGFIKSALAAAAAALLPKAKEASTDCRDTCELTGFEKFGCCGMKDYAEGFSKSPGLQQVVCRLQDGVFEVIDKTAASVPERFPFPVYPGDRWVPLHSIDSVNDRWQIMASAIWPDDEDDDET